MTDPPLCFYCNEPRVAMGHWSEEHTGIGLCAGHAKEHGATFRRVSREQALGWLMDRLDLGELPDGLLAAANPYWVESVQKWKRLHAHTSRETLFRRALYGGRKGRRAAFRLGKAGKGMRMLTARFAPLPGAARRVARELAEMAAIVGR